MSKRILIIDDDEAVRKSFILSLQDTEHTVDTAESGEKGIEKVQNAKYDLIFLDLKMPGMNGVATLRELRKIDKDTYVYIITAFHPEFLDQLKSAAADGIDFQVLRKPISSEAIISLIESTFDGDREESPDDRMDRTFELRLYLIGGTETAENYISDLKYTLEEVLPAQFSLETINILEDPSLARHDNIFVTPTLIKTFPPPVKRVSGDLVDRKKLMDGLGLIP